MAVIVVFRRNRMALRPIHSIKHVVDIQGGLVAGTQVNNNLINSVDAPVLANTQNVETGARVNSIYLKVEVYATGTAALANCYLIIVKNPGGSIASIPANSVGSNDNKRFVIHQEMIMSEKNTTAMPRTLFQGVILIPKGYRRFGINDLLQIGLFAPGVNFDFCVQCIYKEYR